MKGLQVNPLVLPFCWWMMIGASLFREKVSFAALPRVDCRDGVEALGSTNLT